MTKIEKKEQYDPVTKSEGLEDTERLKEEAEQEENQDDEETECGFCLFMKGGGCKDSFIAWEKCVQEAEKNQEDIAEKCFEVTSLLKKCMDAHADYYEPILRAEKAMEEEAARELDKESASSSSTTTPTTQEMHPETSSSSVSSKKEEK